MNLKKDTNVIPGDYVCDYIQNRKTHENDIELFLQNQKSCKATSKGKHIIRCYFFNKSTFHLIHVDKDEEVINWINNIKSSKPKIGQLYEDGLKCLELDAIDFIETELYNQYETNKITTNRWITNIVCETQQKDLDTNMLHTKVIQDKTFQLKLHHIR